MALVFGNDVRFYLQFIITIEFFMYFSLPNAIVRNRLRVTECRTHVMTSGEWHWNACYNSRVDLKNVLRYFSKIWPLSARRGSFTFIICIRKSS